MAIFPRADRKPSEASPSQRRVASLGLHPEEWTAQAKSVTTMASTLSHSRFGGLSGALAGFEGRMSRVSFLSHAVYDTDSF